jgi:hypothetical protein
MDGRQQSYPAPLLTPRRAADRVSKTRMSEAMDGRLNRQGLPI